jgi:hydrogenase nickel incorporation protein HypA/HybF
VHELSITENLVRVLQEQASAQNFQKVLRVRLDVGMLSTLEPDSLVFCFDIVAKETVAEGAQIEIVRSPGVAICRKCNTHLQISAYGEPCTQCESFDLEITSGKDMTIKDIEVV